jgi:hypothetical protein
MDPLSVTATVITLATFIKDLIGVGESIHHSIKKVRKFFIRKSQPEKNPGQRKSPTDW